MMYKKSDASFIYKFRIWHRVEKIPSLPPFLFIHLSLAESILSPFFLHSSLGISGINTDSSLSVGFCSWHHRVYQGCPFTLSYNCAIFSHPVQFLFYFFANLRSFSVDVLTLAQRNCLHLRRNPYTMYVLGKSCGMFIRLVLIRSCQFWSNSQSDKHISQKEIFKQLSLV